VRAVREVQGGLTQSFGINVDTLGSETVASTYVHLLPMVEGRIWDIRQHLDLTSPVHLQSITDSAEVFRKVTYFRLVEVVHVKQQLESSETSY
jgi:hypothetical protein